MIYDISFEVLSLANYFGKNRIDKLKCAYISTKNYILLYTIELYLLYFRCDYWYENIRNYLKNYYLIHFHDKNSIECCESVSETLSVIIMKTSKYNYYYKTIYYLYIKLNRIFFVKRKLFFQ